MMKTLIGVGNVLNAAELSEKEPDVYVEGEFSHGYVVSDNELEEPYKCRITFKKNLIILMKFTDDYGDLIYIKCGKSWVKYKTRQ